MKIVKSILNPITIPSQSMIEDDLNYTLKETKLIRACLINFGKGKKLPFNPKYGICYNLEEYMVKRGICIAEDMDAYTLVRVLSQGWSKHSGRYSYPVDKNLVSDIDFYNEGWEMWKKNTPYGDARRELCLYIAAKLTKLIDIHTSTRRTKGAKK